MSTVLESSETKVSEASPETLKNIQEVLETLLSKENLSDDMQVASLLNPQMYISIVNLMSLSKISELTSNAEDLLKASDRSELLMVDESRSMIRPLVKRKRVTVILRDVLDSVTAEDIMELMKSAPLGEDKVVELKPDINSTWFVSFQEEDTAKDIALWLRGQSLGGASVKTAIKSDHFMRSFFQLPQAPPAGGSFDSQIFSQYGMNSGYWMQSSAKGKGKGKGKKSKRRGTEGATPQGEYQFVMDSAQFTPDQLLDEDKVSKFSHAFRQYSKTALQEICAKVENLTMPASYAKLPEVDRKDIFCTEPNKDWALQQTPKVGPVPSGDEEDAEKKKKKKKKNRGGSEEENDLQKSGDKSEGGDLGEASKEA